MLGGVAIILLSAVIEYQPLSLLNAATGTIISITSYNETKDGIVVARMLLNILFLIITCCYIPFHFREMNVAFTAMKLATVWGVLGCWALILPIYGVVMYLMRLTYNEIQRYSSYWLLQRPANLPKASEIFDGVLSSRDIEFLKTLPSDQFENLVLAGGGAKGVYTIAALYPLEQAGILQNIQRFCGTSVGAIIAVYLAAGASVEKFMEITIHCDLSMVVPSAYQSFFGFFFYCIPCRIARKKALPGTTRAMTLRYQYILRRLGCHENITMAQFKAKFNKDLVITVTNSTTQTTEFLTAESHPDMPVYLAMRASSAIPGVWLPVHWKGNLYIDGACAANYAVWAFDGHGNPPCLANKYAEMNMKTIGLNLCDPGPAESPSLGGTTAGSKPFLKAAKSIEKAMELVHRQEFNTNVEASISTTETLQSGLYPEEQCLLAPARIQNTPGMVSEAVCQMANYPNLSEIFGSMALSHLCANTAEQIFSAQARPHDSVRTVPIGCDGVGLLEFSVTRDQTRMNQVAKDAAKSTIDFLRGLPLPEVKAQPMMEMFGDF